MSDDQFDALMAELQAIRRLLARSVVSSASPMVVAAHLPSECVAESPLGLLPTAAVSPSTAFDPE